MRRALTFVLGILIGQWLTFGSGPSPAELHGLGMAAWERRDYAEALRVWSHGVTLQPDNPILHFRRAMALAELGQRQAAADAYRLALVFEPPTSVAQLAMQALAFLEAPIGGRDGTSATVPLEPSRGVWMVSVTLNGERQGRFLVDTGSSVTVVAPPMAETLKLQMKNSKTSIELQTLSGLTSGPLVTLGSLRVGGVELRELPVVVHDPGPAVDGILGNTFLNRFLVTLDADRRLLHLRPLQ